MSPSPAAPSSASHQRVQQHIAVGMRDDAAGVRHAHAAQHDEVAGAKGMYIEAGADPHVDAMPPGEQRLGERKILGVVTLILLPRSLR